MTTFQVPLALTDNGALVAPAEARKGAAYACPQCRAPVDLHAGEKKRRHFHHRAGASACSTESVTHFVAKELIARAVAAWRDQQEVAPVFVRRCASPGCEATTRQPLPAKVQRAALEHRLKSGRIVDVALLGAGDIPIAAVEVHHTHAVDDEKRDDLFVPWVEVDAAHVCETRGRELVPVTDRFLPWLCAAHARYRKSLGAAARETTHDAARAAAEEPRRRAAAIAALDFRIDDYPGFRLGPVVACTNGHDAVRIEWEGKEPPWPRPRVVVATERPLDTRYSVAEKTARASLPYRRRYVATCPTCGAPL